MSTGESTQEITETFHGGRLIARRLKAHGPVWGMAMRLQKLGDDPMRGTADLPQRVANQPLPERRSGPTVTDEYFRERVRPATAAGKNELKDALEIEVRKPVG